MWNKDILHTMYNSFSKRWNSSVGKWKWALFILPTDHLLLMFLTLCVRSLCTWMYQPKHLRCLSSAFMTMILSLYAQAEQRVVWNHSSRLRSRQNYINTSNKASWRASLQLPSGYPEHQKAKIVPEYKTVLK